MQSWSHSNFDGFEENLGYYNDLNQLLLMMSSVLLPYLNKWNTINFYWDRRRDNENIPSCSTRYDGVGT